jgi:uncharacterized protein YcbK (DUF882 family)
MITLEDYLMGRDKLYPEELETNNVLENATVFLEQVNLFLTMIGIEGKVRSGWRPHKINRQVGGSPNSYHIVGRAIDLVDVQGAIKEAVAAHPTELRVCNLWMEHPSKTPTWCHLDNGKREDRESRVFLP